MKKMKFIAVLLTFAICLTPLSDVAAQPKKSPSKGQSPSPSKSPSPSVKKFTAKPSQVKYVKRGAPTKSVQKLPPSAVTINRGGVSLHFSGGRYYRRGPGGYVAVAPPIGLRIGVLPVGFVVLNTLAATYYYYDGVYYEKSGNEYEVVKAPDDVVVKTLPEETSQVTIDGKEYYVYDSQIYSVVLTPDGKAFKLTGTLEQ